MNRFSYYIVLLLLPALLLGQRCGQGNSTSHNAPSGFFDLESYVAQEVERLQALNPAVEKTAVLNDESEVRKLRDIRWDRELSVLTEADINKPAWQDSYEADTVQNETGYQVQYMPLPDTDRKVRALSLHFNDAGKVVRVEAVIREDNFLFSAERHLEYLPAGHFRMHGSQQTLFLSTQTFDVQLVWGNTVSG